MYSPHKDSNISVCVCAGVREVQAGFDPLKQSLRL